MTVATDLLVLHALRCIGVAELSRVADATGLSMSDTESELIDLAVAGRAARLPGEFGGWQLTAAGRAEDARQIAAALDAAAGARAAAGAAYEAFLVLNPELLDLCSAWLMRTGDEDAAYESRVLGRFADLHRRTGEVLDAVPVPWFGRYLTRLGTALARARAGELDELTVSMTSYHNVWFQLHEDFLATLGIPR